jgi:hypothetical protein
MKLLLHVVLLLTATTVFTSCKSNSTSSNTDAPASSSMTATINGSAWTSQGVKGFRHAGQLSNIQIEGWTGLGTADFKQMVIGFTPSINQPGTYPVSNDRSYQGNYTVTTYNTMKGAYSDLIDGSVTVTTLTDKNIQGTFLFHASGSSDDTVTVTNGKFNIPLD